MKRLYLQSACVTILSLRASAAFAAEGQPDTFGFKTLAVLIGTVLVLFALAWAAKQYGPYARVKKSLGLGIIGQVPVGPKAHISLVRVGRSTLLLGVTQNQVSLLKELPEEDFEKAFGEAEKKEDGQ